MVVHRQAQAFRTFVKLSVADLAGGIFRGLSRITEVRDLMKEEVTRSTTPKYYIGLDVHKSTISIAYAAADGSAPVFYGNCHPPCGEALTAKPALAG